MPKRYKIGTVEVLRVKRSGRRHYVNLPSDLVIAYAIKVGDVLKVEIKEGIRSEVT